MVSNGTLEDSEDKEDDVKILMIGKIDNIVKIGEIDKMISKIR